MRTAQLLAVATAAGFLIGTTALGHAQGARDSAPGQRMQNPQDPAPVPNQPGASGYSPGQQMRQEGGPKASQEPGASGFAPGQQPGTAGQGGANTGTPKSR